MAYLSMSFGKTIFMALLFALYVSGITSIVSNHAEHVTRGFADVAHMSQFEFAIRSSNPGWFSEGMQLLAYGNVYWGKRDISWEITKGPSKPIEDLDQIMTDAFFKWSSASLLSLKPPNPVTEQPDIKIEFHSLAPPLVSWTKLPAGPILDKNSGVTIIIADNVNWRNEMRSDWRNLRFIALYEIGHALGLADSTNRSSIMCPGNKSLITNVDPELHQDEYDEMRRLYDRRLG